MEIQERREGGRSRECAGERQGGDDGRYAAPTVTKQ